MHQASGAGKRKSPKRSSLLTFVLIGDTGTRRVFKVGLRAVSPMLCPLGSGILPQNTQKRPSGDTERPGKGRMCFARSGHVPDLYRRIRETAFQIIPHHDLTWNAEAVHYVILTIK